jgi:ATP-binding cassette subfamily B multidrug efflux pump
MPPTRKSRPRLAWAHADEFIQRLPEGYNTLLGERSSGLSQGQRQLLAIAPRRAGGPVHPDP